MFFQKTPCVKILKMEVELGDGTIVVTPEWFKQVPLIQGILEMYPDDQEILSLDRFQNECEFCAFMAQLQPYYGDVEDELSSLDNLLWAQLEEGFPVLEEVPGLYYKKLVSGTLTRKVIERILKEPWAQIRPIFDLQPASIQEALVQEMALIDSQHPMIAEYFHYLKGMVERNPWSLYPDTKFYRRYTVSDDRQEFEEDEEEDEEDEEEVVEEEEDAVIFNPAVVPRNVIAGLKPEGQLTPGFIVDRGLLPFADRVRDVNIENTHLLLPSALMNGRFKMAQILIDRGADPNYILEHRFTNRRGNYIIRQISTPLMDLVLSEDPEQIQWLIDRGADVNLRLDTGEGVLSSLLQRASEINISWGEEFDKEHSDETQEQYRHRLAEIYPAFEEIKELEEPEDTLFGTNLGDFEEFGFPILDEMIQGSDFIQIWKTLLNAGLVVTDEDRRSISESELPKMVKTVMLQTLKER